VWQFLGVEKIQNGSRCHGNQGAKNVKFTPNFTNFCKKIGTCRTNIAAVAMEIKKQ
jgi:ribosomal protein L35AE/L33A